MRFHDLNCVFIYEIQTGLIWFQCYMMQPHAHASLRVSDIGDMKGSEGEEIDILPMTLDVCFYYI